MFKQKRNTQKQHWKKEKKIKLKYKNIELPLEVKRNEKWEKFRSRDSNKKTQIKTQSKFITA